METSDLQTSENSQTRNQNLVVGFIFLSLFVLTRLFGNYRAQNQNYLLDNWEYYSLIFDTNFIVSIISFYLLAYSLMKYFKREDARWFYSWNSKKVFRMILNLILTVLGVFAFIVLALAAAWGEDIGFGFLILTAILALLYYFVNGGRFRRKNSVETIHEDQ